MLIVLLLAPALFARQLSVDDRLLVREAQLQLAQTHIQMAQAQANVARAESSLTQLIMTLKEKYGCKGQCALDQDLQFVPPPSPEKTAAPDIKEQKEKVLK